MPTHIDTGDDQEGFHSDELTARCPICDSNIGTAREDGVTELGIILPCGHCHGHDCLRTWLEQSSQPVNPTCPYCRDRIPSDMRVLILMMQAPRSCSSARVQPVMGRLDARGMPVGTQPSSRNTSIVTQSTSDVRFEVGMRTTDEIPVFLRVFPRYESLFSLLQRLPGRLFAVARGLPHEPFISESNDDRDIWTLRVLYTQEELTEIRNLIVQDLTEDDQRREGEYRIRAWFAMFEELAPLLPLEEASDEDDAERVPDGPVPANEQLVDLLLRPTHRSLTARGAASAEDIAHMIATREFPASMIDRLRQRVREGRQLVRSSNGIENDLSPAEAGASSPEAVELTPQTPAEPSTRLQPSRKEAQAMQRIINALSLDNFQTAWMSEGVQDTALEIPDVMLLRRLYSPAEIREIAELILHNDPFTPEGAALGMGVLVGEAVEHIRQTLVQLDTEIEDIPASAARATAQRLRDLASLLTRPMHRLLVFNGDSTIHGPSSAAGGRDFGQQDPLEAFAERNRIQATSARAFIRAAHSETPVPLWASAPEVTGSDIPLPELRGEFTTGELAELRRLLHAIHGSRLLQHIDEPVLAQDSFERLSTDIPDVYRFRLQEILLRPIARMRDAEERAVLRLAIRPHNQPNIEPTPSRSRDPLDLAHIYYGTGPGGDHARQRQRTRPGIHQTRSDHGAGRGRRQRDDNDSRQSEQNQLINLNNLAPSADPAIARPRVNETEETLNAFQALQIQSGASASMSMPRLVPVNEEYSRDHVPESVRSVVAAAPRPETIEDTLTLAHIFYADTPSSDTGDVSPSSTSERIADLEAQISRIEERQRTSRNNMWSDMLSALEDASDRLRVREADEVLDSQARSATTTPWPQEPMQDLVEELRQLRTTLEEVNAALHARDIRTPELDDEGVSLVPSTRTEASTPPIAAIHDAATDAEEPETSSQPSSSSPRSPLATLHTLTTPTFHHAHLFGHPNPHHLPITSLSPALQSQISFIIRHFTTEEIECVVGFVDLLDSTDGRERTVRELEEMAENMDWTQDLDRRRAVFLDVIARVERRTEVRETMGVRARL